MGGKMRNKLCKYLARGGSRSWRIRKAADVLERDGWARLCEKTWQYLRIRWSRKTYEWQHAADIQGARENLLTRNFQDEGVVISGVIGFTIVSKNYMHYALTLRESFLRHHPEAQFIIFLMDMYVTPEEIELFSSVTGKGVRIVCFHEVKNAIPWKRIEDMLIKYDILEMNTAIKPFVLEYLCNTGYEKILYIDPDIYFTGNAQVLLNALEENDVLLTPHTVAPFNDEKMPDDLTILNAGTYNLGFLAIRNTPNTVGLCRWWQQKLFDGCFMDLPKGMHVDQKWMDLAPSYFDKVVVWKDPGYNAAYWNLHERTITNSNGQWTANGRPLVFFHFSGLPLEDIGLVSKHQTRHRIQKESELWPLFAEYKEAVLNNGYHVFRKSCEYYFDYLPATTLRIPQPVRRLYKEIVKKVANPFTPSEVHLKKMVEALTQSEKGRNGLSLIEQAIWLQREDLQRAFPDPECTKEDRLAFKAWYASAAQREYGVSEVLRMGKTERESLQSLKRPQAVGLNLIGYFGNLIGTAEFSRLFVKQTYGSGVPFALFPLVSEAHEKISPVECDEFCQYYTEQSAFDTNIFFINAGEIASVHHHYPDLFNNKRNLAVWWWEFDDYFYFNDAFQYVDKVLVLTDFVKKGIAKAAPPGKEVVKITYPFVKNWVILQSPSAVKQKYGIAEDDFLFFFNFDFLSGYDRKNPEALVRAFAMAFGKRKGVKLLLKTVHYHGFGAKVKALENLLDELGIRENICFVHDALSRDEFMTLMNACDCYISLHRSEGLGMGLLEAMYLGKPAIGTAFGGNMDFMTEENSFLVNYEMVPLQEDFGPYRKGWLWAEADIEQAALWMKDVYENPEKAQHKAKQAQKDVREKYSSAAFQADLFRLWQKNSSVDEV